MKDLYWVDSLDSFRQTQARGKTWFSFVNVDKDFGFSMVGYPAYKKSVPNTLRLPQVKTQNYARVEQKGKRKVLVLSRG